MTDQNIDEEKQEFQELNMDNDQEEDEEDEINAKQQIKEDKEDLYRSFGRADIDDGEEVEEDENNDNKENDEENKVENPDAQNEEKEEPKKTEQESESVTSAVLDPEKNYKVKQHQIMQKKEKINRAKVEQFLESFNKDCNKVVFSLPMKIEGNQYYKEPKKTELKDKKSLFKIASLLGKSDKFALNYVIFMIERVFSKKQFDKYMDKNKDKDKDYQLLKDENMDKDKDVDKDKDKDKDNNEPNEGEELIEDNLVEKKEGLDFLDGQIQLPGNLRSYKVENEEDGNIEINKKSYKNEEGNNENEEDEVNEKFEIIKDLDDLERRIKNLIKLSITE